MLSFLAPAEATKLWRELDEATQAHDRAQETAQASQSELAGLIDAKCSWESTVQVECDACAALRKEVDRSKDEQGRLRNEVKSCKTELQCQVELLKNHEEDVARLGKSNDDVSSQLSEAQKHCEGLEAAAQYECRCARLSLGLHHFFS